MTTKNKALTPEQARRLMKKRGWTYRKAAAFVGVNSSHLSRVFCGQRISKSLLERIAALPDLSSEGGAR